MNVLDENILDGQRDLLRKWGIHFRQIGREIGRQGMKDDEIIPFLYTLRNPTLFTIDADFYKRHLRHARYCLVNMEISQHLAAQYIRQFLSHPAFDTQAKRMGAVVQLSSSGLVIWRLHSDEKEYLSWHK